MRGWRYDNADHKTPQPFATMIPSGKGAPDRYFTPGEPTDGNDWALALEQIAAQVLQIRRKKDFWHSGHQSASDCRKA